jgi:hypothetical protein
MRWLAQKPLLGVRAGWCLPRWPVVGHKTVAMLIVVSLLVCSVLPLSAIASISATSQAMATATLTILSGSVDIQVAGSELWHEAQDGITLDTGDRVRTREKSQALVTFFEGSTTTLGPGTDITIRTLEKSQDSPVIYIRLYQWVGTTWNRVVQLADPSSKYEIETPAAVALVRGTSFEVQVQISGSTRLFTSAGNVRVTAQGVSVDVLTGQETTIEPGQPPHPPANAVPTFVPAASSSNPPSDTPVNTPAATTTPTRTRQPFYTPTAIRTRTAPTVTWTPTIVVTPTAVITPTVVVTPRVIITPTVVVTPTVIITPTIVLTQAAVFTPTAVVTSAVNGGTGTPSLDRLINKDVPPTSAMPQPVGKPKLEGAKPPNKPARPPRPNRIKTHKISLDILRSVPFLATWLPLDDWNLVVPQLPIPPSWDETYRRSTPMQALSLR